MKIEHFAINVEDPRAMARWYEVNLGMTVVRQSQDKPAMTFLADDSGRVMIEIYNNPAGLVPDYKSMDPLILHIAFVSLDPAYDRDRLLRAGASLVSDDHLDDGSQLVMMRDPWGLAIQFCKRGTPMLAESEKK
jgi:glyoxylase I family protein